MSLVFYVGHELTNWTSTLRGWQVWINPFFSTITQHQKLNFKGFICLQRKPYLEILQLHFNMYHRRECNAYHTVTKCMRAWTEPYRTTAAPYPDLVHSSFYLTSRRKEKKIAARDISSRTPALKFSQNLKRSKRGREKKRRKGRLRGKDEGD